MGQPLVGTTAEEASELVTAADLERHLALLRAEVSDPRVGLYGPESKLWEINREAVLFLGGGRAALLQVAHPFVAAAIDQHSPTKTDPLRRFHRTFLNVFAMVFGDLESAFAAARRVHRVHQRITGSLSEAVGDRAAGSVYRANEPHALLWVHATLWETSILVFETIVRPLSAEEKESYYRETRRFAHLFGIESSLLPPDWTRFEQYNHEMWESSRLAVGRAASEIAGYLFVPQHRAMTPLMRWLEIMTAGLMPKRLRDDFGLRFEDRERRIFERSIPLLRRSHRFWPGRLRFVPPYIAARRRLSGKKGHDRVGELLTRLWLGA